MSTLCLLSSAARGFMGERTFNEVWVESDGDDEVTGPAQASPLALGTPSGVNDALHASMQQLQDLGPSGDTPSGDHMHGHAFRRLSLIAATQLAIMWGHWMKAVLLTHDNPCCLVC